MNEVRGTNVRLAGARVLVVGLGRFGGGVGVTRWLALEGAQITVTDQAKASTLAESLQAIADCHATLYMGGHDECDLSCIDLAIINPAVHKPMSPLFQEILRRKIPWTTEMNLFCQRCPAQVIAVTGSYGKSTTCAMLAHVLRGAAERGASRFTDVHLGGNIGRSLLLDLPQIRHSDVVVLEMSNSQLEDLPQISWSPAMVVITNLHPHHLDRYDSFAGYVQAKLNLVRAGGAECPVFVGEMHPEAAVLFNQAVAAVSIRPIPVKPVEPPVELSVPGRHNLANAACVLAVGKSLGFADSQVRELLRDFRGLPHRLELVRVHDGVGYINDSKSTAPAATIIALEAMLSHEPYGAGTNQPRKVVAIVGGQKKTVPLADCVKALERSCRAVICYGEAGPSFSQALRTEITETPKIKEVGDLPQAVEAARQEAQEGDTVLFSPGAPSFDQYANFTERGRHFVELVNAL